jgi:hypothetical protein
MHNTLRPRSLENLDRARALASGNKISGRSQDTGLHVIDIYFRQYIIRLEAKSVGGIKMEKFQ